MVEVPSSNLGGPTTPAERVSCSLPVRTGFFVPAHHPQALQSLRTILALFHYDQLFQIKALCLCAIPERLNRLLTDLGGTRKKPEIVTVVPRHKGV